MGEEINVKEIFGIRGIVKRYVKDLRNDFLIPFAIAMLMMAVAWLFDVNSPLFMAESLNAGLVVTPVLLSVLVAGYVLLLTIYFSGNIGAFKKSERGRDLLYQISSNYAFCIINAIIALVTTVFFSFLFHLNIQVSHPGFVNYPCTFVVYFFMFFTLKNMKDLVVALFNFGQSFIFEDQLNPKAEKENKEERWYDCILKCIGLKRI